MDFSTAPTYHTTTSPTPVLAREDVMGRPRLEMVRDDLGGELLKKGSGAGQSHRERLICSNSQGDNVSTRYLYHLS